MRTLLPRGGRLPVLLLLLLGACARPDREPPAGLLVSTSWLARHLGDEDLVVLHVGTDRSTYEEAHVPGARFVPWEAIAVERDGRRDALPDDADLLALARGLGLGGGERLVVYDEVAGLRAARCFFVLDYLGLGGRVALLDGHLTKWEMEGRTLASDPPRVEPSAFVPSWRREVLAEAEWLREALGGGAEGGSATLRLVDARPEAEYAGRVAGEGVTRPGRIPGAVNVPWKRHLTTDAPWVLRSEEDLRALFAGTGLGAQDEVVVYCRTGRQAAHTYFTLRRLGYAPRLYEGSYVEWSARDDTPVESPDPDD